MADVIGLSDVSTPDTGKGSQLKTGGRRKHNMPSLKICKKEWKKRGYSSLRDCTDYRGKSKTSETQKAGTSAKEEQYKVGWDIAKSKNVRMKAKLKKEAKKRSPSY